MEQANFLWYFPVRNLWERYCQDFKCPVVFHDTSVTELVLQQSVAPQGKDYGPADGAGFGGCFSKLHDPYMKMKQNK